MDILQEFIDNINIISEYIHNDKDNDIDIDKYKKMTKTILEKCPTNNSCEINLNVPFHGDIFIGIKNNNYIKNVIYSFKNNIQEFSVNGILNNEIWLIPNLPVPMRILKKNITINCSIILDLNNTIYDIEGVYGLINEKKMKNIVENNIFYKYDNFEIICGFPQKI